MKTKPTHSLLPALAGLLLAAGTSHHLHASSLASAGAVENPRVGSNEAAEGQEADLRSETRAKTLPARASDLDEVEKLLMQSDINPSNRNKETEDRLHALIRRIEPSSLGALLARIDASLNDSGYFEAIRRPPSAIRSTEEPTFTEGDRKKDFFRQFLVREWATHELDEALAYALQADRLRYRETFVIAALSTQVTRAPLEAMARVEALADPGLRDRVRQEIYRAWLNANPTSAMSWARAWPDDRQRKSYLGMAGAVISEVDPAFALKAAAEIQALDERRETLSGIASTWSHRDPQALAAYLRDDLHANPVDNQVMVSFLVYNWYHRDRQAALNWIAGLSEGPTRGEAERFLTQVMKVDWPSK